MPKKGHTEEQIIGALKQYESGEKVADICRKLGVSQASFYTRKKQYVGMGVQELRELRQLRDGSSGWLRISRWTGRSCRRSSQKSSKASPAMPAGEVGTGGISGGGAALGTTDAGAVGDFAL